MPLTEDVSEVARSFGQALHQDKTVQHYLEAVANLAADPEASDLDQRYQALLAELTTRQKSGEQLPQDELDTFFALKKQVQANSLIRKRDSALAVVKTYLVVKGQELSAATGLDFVRLALS